VTPTRRANSRPSAVLIVICVEACSGEGSGDLA
jgi:hypothetical protein